MKQIKTRQRYLSSAFAGGAGLLLLLSSQSGLAQQRLVDEVRAVQQKDAVRIQIDLLQPFQYLSHAPQVRGAELQVFLRPVGALPADYIEPGENDLNLVEDEGRLVQESFYEFDQVSNRLRLVVRFSGSVDFTVVPGRDFRSLEIVIARAGVRDSGAVKLRQGADRRQEQVAAGKAVTRFLVYLESSLEDPDLERFSRDPLLSGYQLVVRQARIKGQSWQRVGIGYFDTLTQARQVRRRLLEQYPGAWVAQLTTDEAANSRAAVKRPVRQPSRPKSPRLPAAKPLPKLDAAKIADLMEQARQAMARQQYSRAIALYTKVLRYPDHPYLRQAQELLGLARERNGQSAHARAEYERYLELYPDGEGVERVQQRLTALLTARQLPRQKLKSSRGRGEQQPGMQWSSFGSLSQNYRRDTSTTDSTGTQLTQSLLATDIDLSARGRDQDRDLRARLTGGYDQDFLQGSSNSNLHVSSLYVDASSKRLGLGARLGRQSRSSGGVLGRFDGALLRYQINPQLGLDLVTGLPVNSSSDGLDQHRWFYGASATWGSGDRRWTLTPYFIEQRNDGLVDRRALGGELRYFKSNRSLFGLVDYDIFYSELNTLLLLGTWTFPDSTTINAQLDYRKSPLLLTGNALQGQLAQSLDELKGSFTESQIHQLAEDRTATSRSFTLGLSRPFNAQLQISGDVTLTDLTDTPASGGVAAVPGSGIDAFYNLQLIGSDLYKPGDLGILGLRYSDTSSLKTTSISINSRYPISSYWRINPRVRLDYRDRTSDGSNEWLLAPSLRMDYRWKRRYQFELELGGEWSSVAGSATSQESSSLFFSAGYRIEF